MCVHVCMCACSGTVFGRVTPSPLFVCVCVCVCSCVCTCVCLGRVFKGVPDATCHCFHFAAGFSHFVACTAPTLQHALPLLSKHCVPCCGRQPLSASTDTPFRVKTAPAQWVSSPAGKALHHEACRPPCCRAGAVLRAMRQPQSLWACVPCLSQPIGL